ncbi:MAG TPA: response regulator, partial [Hellea balneolensis]|nr:response regulator [Hellea balneolensis]
LALEAVKKTNYDLIFMDMRMPNMDGLEATRKIRAYGATLPIIALTANAFDDDRNACFDSGMNDFMTKPVSAEELVEMVTEWTKPENRGRSAA